MDEKGLRAAVDNLDRARVARDDAIAQAAREGMRQVDIVRVIGLTRERVRQIVRAAEAEHRRGGEP